MVPEQLKAWTTRNWELCITDAVFFFLIDVMIESDRIHTPKHPSLPQQPTWVTSTPAPRAPGSSRRQTVYPTPASSSAPARTSTPSAGPPRQTEPKRSHQQTYTSPVKRARLGDSKHRPIVLDSDSDSDSDNQPALGSQRSLGHCISSKRRIHSERSGSLNRVDLDPEQSRRTSRIHRAPPSPTPSITWIESPSPPPIDRFDPFHRRIAREARLADRLNSERRGQRGRAFTPSTSGEDTDLDSDTDVAVRVKVDPRFIMPQRSVGSMFFLQPGSDTAAPRQLIHFGL